MAAYSSGEFADRRVELRFPNQPRCIIPSSSGLRGLMLLLFQWVRSRTAAMVALVVPISLVICASDS